MSISEKHALPFIPLSSVNKQWVSQNVCRTASLYNFSKRVIDVVLASVLILFSLPLYPPVALAIKIEDGGPVFITQRRVGKNTKEFLSRKFRSMRRNEDGVWLGESGNPITRVGRFLRKTRIDELPQLWSVLRGELSIVGPRPDIVGLAERLRREIPHYDVRYFVKPGISGWAQVKQGCVARGRSPQSVEETKIRLEYDLYYIKNRSFVLDCVIAIRTAKLVLSSAGS